MRNGRFNKALQSIRAAPPVIWILLGFLFSYLCFFLRSVFFSGPRMDILQMVVPAMTPIGADLRQTLISVRRLFLGEGTPYVGNIPYPPLVYVLLGPMLLFGSGSGYIVFTLTTLVAFAWQTLILAHRIAGGRQLTTSLLLVFVSGMMSYGLLFELERAQFNVIAALLAYLAIWIFHSDKKRVWLAYALLSISVHLKLYPLVFVLMLIDDWRDWKGNFRRLLLLGAANLALAFVLGPWIFLDFVNALRARTSFPQTIRFDNHSAYSFGRLVTEAVAARGLPGPAQAASVLEYLLPAAVGMCVLLLMLKAYRQRIRGLSASLLLACALAAILIPPVSHDYTLTILAAPVAIFLSKLEQQHADGWRSMPLTAAILVFAAAYSSTLFPLGYKPGVLVLQSNFPVLFTMLVTTTLIAWWWPPNRNA